MKKSRAIFLLITLVVVIGGYVAWAAWEPVPTLQSMKFWPEVDAEARSAAEADFRAHPLGAPNFTWQRFWKRLANPYQSREKPLIWVTPSDSTNEDILVAIFYPKEIVHLERSRKDGRWTRAFIRMAP